MDGINTSNFDWTQAINQALNASGVEGAQGVTAKGAVEGNSLNITVTDANGHTVNVTVENPTLDEAGATADNATLEKITAKLAGAVEELQQQYQEIQQTVESANLSGSSTGTSKVLFDIYKLMALMVDIAQEQREVARNERYADLTMQTAAIDNQAAAQQSAARTGLIMSVCFSAVSVLCSLGSAIKSGLASTKALQIQKQAGCDQAQHAYALAQSRTTAGAQTELTKVESGMTQAEIDAAKGQFASSTEAKAQLGQSEAARTEYIQTKDANVRTQTEAADQRITTAQNELETAQTEARQAQDAYAEARRSDDTSFEEVESLRVARDSANANVATKETALRDARAAKTDLLNRLGQEDPHLAELNQGVKGDFERYETALSGDMDSLQGKLNIAQGELEQAKGVNPPDQARIAELEQQVATLEKSVTWGRAHVTHEYLANNMTDALKANLNDCKATYLQQKDLLENNAEYKAAMADAQKYTMISQGVGQLSQVCQSIVQYTSSMKESEATSEQKEQKQAEAAREESSELFQSAQELLNSVLKCISSLQQAEAQTIQQILA